MSGFDTAAVDTPGSTLMRPSKKELARFTVSAKLQRDTVRDYLREGWSLAICCRACTHLAEWTPYDLEERFGSRLDLHLADLLPRLRCSDEGCGSRDIALFPHPYDGEWNWPRSEPAGDD